MILNGIPRRQTPVNYVPWLGGKSALLKVSNTEGVNAFAKEVCADIARHLFCNLVCLLLSFIALVMIIAFIVLDL